MREEVRQQMMSRAVANLSGDEDDYRQHVVPLPTAEAGQASTMRLSTVGAKHIRWIWDGHIPFGALTLVIGDPGLGKSQLTLDLAARVTRGTPWPDEAPCDVGNVLLLCSEDSIERTVVPRLQASGADLERVVVLNEVLGKDGKAKMFDLKTDLAILENIVANQYIDMVVIDPLNGYLGATNSWNESEVRNVLGPACAMVDRHDVALIGVVHLTKDTNKSAIHRVLGSVAFSAVTRAMFAVAPNQKYPQMRYFVSVKQNYTAPPPTLGFCLAGGGGLAWDGQTYPTVSAENILVVTGAPEEKAERRAAREFLANLLDNGPVKTKDVRTAADAALVSPTMLHRAKYDLKVISVHRGSPSGTGIGGYWEWRLP